MGSEMCIRDSPLAAFGWLSRRAITPSIATDNAADAVGIALTPQAPGLGGIRHLNRFGVQLALALKNQVIKRRHTNRRRALLFSNKEMNSTSLRQGRRVDGYFPQMGDADR